MPPDFQLTDQVFWQNALVWGLFDLVLVSLLIWRVSPTRFRELKWPLVGTAAIGFTIFGTALLVYFAESYYRYFFPEAARALGLLITPIYAVIALALWWLALRLPLHPVLAFCLLGGVESFIEHFWGIYGLGILQRVPMLAGVGPLPIFVFAFFEYVLYWGVILGTAALLDAVWRRRAEPGKRQVQA